MKMLDRDGTFRASIAGHGVSTTKNGFPQWVAEFLIEEMYDAENEVWETWGEYDMGVTGYFVLVGGNSKPTRNCDQIKDALGWPGRTFVSLAEMDLIETKVLIQVETEEYNGKETRQVTWIDKHDADPNRTLRKLNAAGVKNLDSQYASVLAGSATAPPAKAPAKAPSTAAPSTTDKPSSTSAALPEGDTLETTEPPTKPKVKRGRKPKTPPGPPAAPTATPETTETSDPPTGRELPLQPPRNPLRPWPTECTFEEAWEKIMNNISPGKTEEASEMWLSLIEGAGGDESAITPTQWADIRDTVDKKFGIPF